MGVNLNQQLYVVSRTEIGSFSLSTGYNSNAVPKLYTVGSAKSVCNAKNERLKSHAKTYGEMPVNPWQVVPVTLTFGEPIQYDKIKT